MFSLIPFEAFPGGLSGGAVDADIGYALKPVLHVLAHVLLVPEDLTVKAILLDVPDVDAAVLGTSTDDADAVDSDTSVNRRGERQAFLRKLSLER